MVNTAENKTAPKVKRKTRSIAKRLSAALAWRAFFRGLFLSILICAVLLVGWCCVKEGGFGADTHRSFSGKLNLASPREFLKAAAEMPADALRLANHLIRGEEAGYGEYFPFSGVSYVVSNETGSRSFPAEHILALLWYCFIVYNLIGLARAAVSSFVSSGIIRRHLRPLDDMANLAEELSDEKHTVGSAEVRGEAGKETLDLKEAIGEIDDVSDSGARIEFRSTELEGLESALNKMLDRLEEGKKKQIRFVDDASHELRTPIAVIHGYADMLDRWGKDDPKIRDEAISAIKTESEHMTTLIDQLLFLARGEMDRHVLEKQPVNAQALLDEIMVESEMLDTAHLFRMLSVPGGDTDDDEETTARLDSLRVLADPAMLKQAVRILRDNAVKYTPAGGEVTFKAYARGEKVCFEVGDSGIGIPKDELPRVFDRFYRGTNARTDNAGGSGLGLSIAQWIVKEHGGSIEAISSEGVGTKMTIVLDQTQPEDAQP
ncbi:MAG: HAMP domain-containing histidine kinase [Clostridia bacterium]|nr:HAMP domain-containing histidine kinase [Clostridia bacterium]